MAKLPVVAIIGRPNTGKSTLFNRLIGKRQAIVSDAPGTTRDPVASRVVGEEVDYLLMDTGGMGGGTEDTDFEDNVEAQSLIALEHADVIVFVVDSREELTAADHKVVGALRKKHKRHVPVFLVVSKCDNPETLEEVLPRFYELAIADHVFAVSAVHASGMDQLEEGIESTLKKMQFEKRIEEESSHPRIAIVGRPNVGKSSLVNALMNEKQRATQGRMVSDKPGTTRDATDTVVKYEGREYLLLDTAGLRKNREWGIAAFAALRTLQAMEDADLTVLVLDPTQNIGRQDKRIAALAIERGTGLIVLVNKIDLLTTQQKELFFQDLVYEFSFCRWAPVLFASSNTKENLSKLFKLIDAVCENRLRRIETNKINRWFKDEVADHGRIAKTKYVTQVGIAPPTFALFLNDPKRLHFSSLRYIERKLRESFAFSGTPVRWLKRGKE